MDHYLTSRIGTGSGAGGSMLNGSTTPRSAATGLNDELVGQGTNVTGAELAVRVLTAEFVDHPIWLGSEHVVGERGDSGVAGGVPGRTCVTLEAAFTDQLHVSFASIDALHQLTNRRLRSRLARIGIDGDAIQVTVYLERCASRGWTSDTGRREFAELILANDARQPEDDFIDDQGDPTRSRVRHFMATEMLNAGEPLPVVARRLDHQRPLVRGLDR